MNVLSFICYDLGISEAWNSCEVISYYLQIYMLVRLGEGMYTRWFDSSK